MTARNVTAKQPIAAQRPLTRTHHGREFVDNYEWLRDKDNPEVRAYLEAENEYTKAHTADLTDLTDTVYGEIKSRVKETDMSVPVRNGDFWYYGRSVEGKNYGVSCRIPAVPKTAADAWVPPVLPEEGAPEGEQIIFDANLAAEGHEFFSMGAGAVSLDGRYLAYSTDVVGDERYTLRIRDLTTGEDLPDTIEDISAGATWVGSDWIFYQRVDEAWRPDSVWRHKVGTDVADDVRIFHEPDEAYWVGVGTTRSEKYLLIEVGSKTTSEVWAIDTANIESDPWCIRERDTGIEYDVEHAVIAGRDRFLITHNALSVDYSVGIADVGPLPALTDITEVIAPRDGVRIEGVSAFAGHILLAYRRGGIGRLALCTLLVDGDQALNFRELEFAEELYSVGASANPEWDTPVLRFGYGSFTTPSQTWEMDIATGERTLLKEQEIPGGYDKTQYQATRMWATAADGTEVPISVVRRVDLDMSSPKPTLLYAYGSYEMPVDPGFSVSRLSLLDRGMVWAVAHVRGGGEMGRSWWLNGREKSKPNTFTDFIACADELVAQGITTHQMMAAEGGSAGGMLMGAVANMAPEKFCGIQAVVPFVDSLTSMLMPELPLTVVEWEEWGNPLADPEIYDLMASYSAYENVRDDVEYPEILALTSLNDTRVLYVEPAKWIAKLQEIGKGGPFLLKTEMSAGHGGVSGRYAKWKETAYEYAWILRVTGAA